MLKKYLRKLICNYFWKSNYSNNQSLVWLRTWGTNFQRSQVLWRGCHWSNQISGRREFPAGRRDKANGPSGGRVDNSRLGTGPPPTRRVGQRKSRRPRAAERAGTGPPPRCGRNCPWWGVDVVKGWSELLAWRASPPHWLDSRSLDRRSDGRGLGWSASQPPEPSLTCSHSRASSRTYLSHLDARLSPPIRSPSLSLNILNKSPFADGVKIWRSCARAAGSIGRSPVD